jgi:hypothetical protein
MQIAIHYKNWSKNINVATTRTSIECEFSTGTDSGANSKDAGSYGVTQ